MFRYRRGIKRMAAAVAVSLWLGNGAVIMPSVALAAAEDTAQENPLSFTERIRQILDHFEDARETANTRFHQPKPETKAVTPLVMSNTDVTDFSPHADTYVDSTEDTRHDFDWQGAPLNSTLYAISKASGKKVVINGDLKGTVYTTLEGVTYREALDYLASIFNFNWMQSGDAILVSTDDLMKQSRVFPVHYADQEKIKNEIKSMGVDESNIYVNTEQGTVSVTGTPYQIAAVSRRLTAIDKPVQQCLIIAQLIELSHGKKLDLGIQYNLPTYAHTADSGGIGGKFIDHLTFSSSLQANRALSKGRVIARPMILTKNGEKANISMGDSVPILKSESTTTATTVTVEYKDIGTKLEVTPSILQNGEVNMVVSTEVSNITKWIKSGNVSAPQIATRKADTIAHVKSGESFVIGGLMSMSDLDNLSGIPGLMDLPILGSLFRYHSKSREYTEVFIMLTPYIVSDDIDPAALLRKAGNHHG